jgi:hypothetical protein
MRDNFTKADLAKPKSTVHLADRLNVHPGDGHVYNEARNPDRLLTNVRVGE